MWEMESPKQGHRHTLKEKIRAKTIFTKVTGVKCRDKSESKLSQKEKIAKDTRFQSQQLIPD